MKLEPTVCINDSTLQSKVMGYIVRKFACHHEVADPMFLRYLCCCVVGNELYNFFVGRSFLAEKRLPVESEKSIDIIVKKQLSICGEDITWENNYLQLFDQSNVVTKNDHHFCS